MNGTKIIRLLRAIEHKKKVGGGTLPPFHRGRELIDVVSNQVVVVLEVGCADMLCTIIENCS
jgi:hypothetical protein